MTSAIIQMRAGKPDPLLSGTSSFLLFTKGGKEEGARSLHFGERDGFKALADGIGESFAESLQDARYLSCQVQKDLLKPSYR